MNKFRVGETSYDQSPMTEVIENDGYSVYVYGSSNEESRKRAEEIVEKLNYERPPTRRELLFRYCSLDYLQKLQIAILLDLVENKDANLTPTLFFKTIIDRAILQEKTEQMLSLIGKAENRHSLIPMIWA